MNAKLNLAIISKHPVHSNLPLYKRLAKHPSIDLTIFFGSNLGMDEGLVTILENGKAVKKFNAPDINDLNYKFLRNFGKESVASGFWSPINPGIFKELKNQRFDAILIHGYATLMDIIAYIAAKLTRTPVITRGETYLRPEQSRLWRAIKYFYIRNWLKGVSYCFPIGTVSKNFYKFFDVPEEQLSIVPHSVENNEIQQDAATLADKKPDLLRKYGLSTDLPKIIFVGRLVQRKHPMDLLQAFIPLQNSAELIIVGEGPEINDLTELIQNENVSNVLLAGARMPNETRELFSLSDIFVLCSSFEPWGFVVNEAMCFSLPIVLADGVAATYDLLEQGENGYQYTARDIDTLTNLLSELINDPLKRKQMGQRSFEIINTWNYEIGAERIAQALATLKLNGESS